MKKVTKILTTTTAAVALSLSSLTAFAAEDVFQDFDDLSSEYQEGRDFVIESRLRLDSDTIVIAPHGGRIETGTDQITKEIAKDDFSYYIFKANVYKDKNKDGRNDLHLTSTHFDEPEAIMLTAQHNKAVSIHGASGSDKKVVYVGGRNEEMKSKISSALRSAGFQIENPPSNLAGKSQDNIVNKSRNLQGVQLELTRGLRDELVENDAQMKKFANAVRTAISLSSSHPDGRTYDYSVSSFNDSVWMNSGKPFYLTSDDVIRGVQSTISPDQTAKVRFDFYDQSGKLVLSRTAQSEGHSWFIHTTGLKTGYYKIKINNASGNPSWVYGGLVY
jgi:phage replication-related protein YjqB (UPF0714/DUF867 family)